MNRPATSQKPSPWRVAICNLWPGSMTDDSRSVPVAWPAERQGQDPRSCSMLVRLQPSVPYTTAADSPVERGASAAVAPSSSSPDAPAALV